MKRTKAVIVKEFAHIFRDPASLTIVFLMPVLMIFIFGYSISYDLNRIDAGFVDLSHSDLSGQLLDKFTNNRYFVMHDLQSQYKDPLAQGEESLKAGKLKELIVIPADFSQKIRNNRKAELGLVIDGSDANVANLVYQYNELILLEFISELRNLKESLKISTKVYFNPEVKSAFFFIPGLIALLLVMISALLTSLSISRERESGSLDLVFISPLRSHEIIIGKTIPYIFVALMDGIIILLFARFWFGIPFKGSLLVLLLFSLLYIITGLSLGILISTAAPSQKSAMFATLLVTLLPSVMLSGFIFPLDSLAAPLRAISYIVPATYFLKIIRGVILKGAELKYFVVEGLAMVLMSLFLLAVSTVKFNRNRKRSA